MKAYSFTDRQLKSVPQKVKHGTAVNNQIIKSLDNRLATIQAQLEAGKQFEALRSIKQLRRITSDEKRTN